MPAFVIPAALFLFVFLGLFPVPSVGAYADPFPYYDQCDRADQGLVVYPPSRPYPYGGYYNPYYRPYTYRYRYVPPPSPYYSPYPYPYAYPSPYPYTYPRRYPYYPCYGPYYRR